MPVIAKHWEHKINYSWTLPTVTFKSLGETVKWAPNGNASIVVWEPGVRENTFWGSSKGSKRRFHLSNAIIFHCKWTGGKHSRVKNEYSQYKEIGNYLTWLGNRKYHWSLDQNWVEYGKLGWRDNLWSYHKEPWISS